MTFFGKTTVFLAGLLMFSISSWAADNMTGNPYAAIVSRNIFDLTAVTPAPPPPKPTEPPPKIEANGIMSIFGQLQVLFKVMEKPQPGKPPQQESYILSQGQRQDDIEVTRIDEKSGTITFNNHGTVQEITLTKAPEITSVTPPTPGGRPNIHFPNRPNRGFNRGNNFASRFNRGPNPANGSQPNNSDMSGMSETSGNSNVSKEPPITPEEQVIMIEAERAKYESENNPIAKLLPITALTPDNTGNGNNAPSAPPAP